MHQAPAGEESSLTSAATVVGRPSSETRRAREIVGVAETRLATNFQYHTHTKGVVAMVPLNLCCDGGRVTMIEEDA